MNGFSVAGNMTLFIFLLLFQLKKGAIIKPPSLILITIFCFSFFNLRFANNCCSMDY